MKKIVLKLYYDINIHILFILDPSTITAKNTRLLVKNSVVLTFEQQGNIVSEAICHCSIKDSFSFKKGCVEAMVKIMKDENMPKKERTIIWKAFIPQIDAIQDVIDYSIESLDMASVHKIYCKRIVELKNKQCIETKLETDRRAKKIQDKKIRKVKMIAAQTKDL